jgi:hypothetical protein
MTMRSKAEEYWERAKEAESKAQHAHDGEVRETYKVIARQYGEMADQIEKLGAFYREIATSD